MTGGLWSGMWGSKVEKIWNRGGGGGGHWTPNQTSNGLEVQMGSSDTRTNGMPSY